MSSFDRAVRRRVLQPAVLAALAAALFATSACTVRPLYGRSDAFVGGAPVPALTELKGRIEVAPVNDRTSQIVRNALIFGFNGGETPVAALYRVSFTVIGFENVVSIQSGSGIPSASLYKLTVNYVVVRTTDGKQIAVDSRFANAPFDRSRQLFAASRAYRNAQERAGKDVAAQIRIAVLGAIERDLATLPASAPAPLGK